MGQTGTFNMISENFQYDLGKLYYNISCLFAKQNKVETSLSWLQKAIEKGYNNLSIIQKDNDLKTIRHTQRYKHLIKSLLEHE